MKTQFFLFLLLLCSGSSFAQIVPGTISLGGFVTYSRQSGNVINPVSLQQEEFRDYVFSAQPELSVFATDNLLLGVGIGVESRSSRISGFNVHQVEHTYSLSLAATRFFPLFDRAYATLAFDIQAGTGKRKFPDRDTRPDELIFTWQARLSPGFTYFLSERWALQAIVGRVGYSRRREKDDTATEAEADITNRSFANFNLSNISLGLRYFFVREE